MSKTPADVITSQKEIAEAPTNVLLNTYNWLTGKAITRFSSRGAAEAQVANAILAALDRAGQKGVPKGQKPRVEDGALGGASKTTPAKDLAPSRAAAAKSPADSMRAIAAIATAGKVKVKPEKKPRKVAREVVHAVRFTPGGRSRCQEGSKRNAVLQFIIGSKNGMRTIDEIDAHFKVPCRGYVQKLLDVGHVEIAN